MVNLFMRAIRRARIPIKHTEGFHRKPKLVFEDALPIGMESLEEHLFFAIGDGLPPHRVIADINRGLPEGIRVSDCRFVAGKKLPVPAAVRYRVELPGGGFSETGLAEYLSRSEAIFWRPDKKGRPVGIDLKAAVEHLGVLSPSTAEVTIRCTAGRSLRPAEVIREIFQTGEEALKQARIMKIRSEYGSRQSTEPF
jgi:radical SAM-linked protein